MNLSYVTKCFDACDIFEHIMTMFMEIHEKPDFDP